MARNAMPEHLKDQLLDALMHYMPQEVRGKVMREVPAAYNAYVGREIVLTTRSCDVHDAVAGDDAAATRLMLDLGMQANEVAELVADARRRRAL